MDDTTTRRVAFAAAMRDLRDNGQTMPPTTGPLLEEYRPAWEIHPSWEIHLEDDRWVQVADWSEWNSTDPAKDSIVKLGLADGTECNVWSTQMVMTRLLEPRPYKAMGSKP